MPSIVVIREPHRGPGARPVTQHRFDWTADETGDVSFKLPAIYGCLQKVDFDSGDGASCPWPGYSVALVDEAGDDALGGACKALYSSARTVAQVGTQAAVGRMAVNLAPVNLHGNIALKITRAGPKRQGSVTIFTTPLYAHHAIAKARGLDAGSLSSKGFAAFMQQWISVAETLRAGGAEAQAIRELFGSLGLTITA
jgi:hypothetical protein